MEKYKICLKIFGMVLLSMFLYPFRMAEEMMLADNPTWMAIAGIMFLLPLLIISHYSTDPNLFDAVCYGWAAILCLYGYVSFEILRYIERKTDVFI